MSCNKIEFESKDHLSGEWPHPAVLAALCGILILAGVVVALFINPLRTNNREFSQAMKELGNLGAGTQVRFSDITPFEWDKVYNFDPYVSKEEIEKTIGVEDRRIQETTSEGMEQLIFIKDGRLVCSVTGYSSSLGWFVDLGEGEEGKNYRMVRSSDDEMTVEYEGDIPGLVYGSHMLTGEIKEIHGTTAVVETDDLWDMYQGPVLVSVVLDEETADKAREGDEIGVTYREGIMETSPLQLSGQEKRN